jgi:hypothetical protein
MNALLQHRGHNLMGAGRSIAVQNFNEQACILGLGAFYAGMTQLRPVGLRRHHRLRHSWWPARCELIRRWHRRNTGAPRRRSSSGCSPSHAPTPTERARRRCRRLRRAPRWLPVLALVANALTWGLSWWPLSLAAGARPAPAVGHAC